MKYLQRHIACPMCTSTDAYSIWEDGHGHCFSCGKFTPATRASPSKDKHVMSEATTGFTFEYVPWRGLTKETMRFFGCQMKINAEGKPLSIQFPYTEGAAKVRLLDKKEFYTTGEMGNASLFGMDKFSSGSANAITITEGELDALSVFQIMGSKYPVVSVRSSSSAGKDCAKNFDYLNSFEKIYLAFDSDEVGQKAAKSVAELFDFNKLYHVKLSKYKDANEYLTNTAAEEFKRIWWNAERFLPEGIVSSMAGFKQILADVDNTASAAYPFETLQRMSGGLRTGEVTLVTAMEGMGKTEIIRAIEYHLLKTTDANIAIIHLEESKIRSLKGLVGYELNQPVHLQDSQVSAEQIEEILSKLVIRDDRLHIYSHFGSDDPTILLDTIRFLVTVCGCQYVFLDHITMVVSGLELEDERRTLDFLSTNLATMVHDLDFSLVLVSHVNDAGKTRGSRNISKIASLWLSIDRDHLNESEDVRNTVFLTIKKNRFTGQTGPAGKLTFNPQTFKLTETDLPV